MSDSKGNKYDYSDAANALKGLSKEELQALQSLYGEASAEAVMMAFKEGGIWREGKSKDH